MATNLDKSLDEIIKSKPRRYTRQKRSVSSASVKKPVAPKAQSKRSTASTKKKTEKPTNVGLNEAAVLADRVILRNVPVDIDERSVKEYFSHEIGAVKSCQASYTAKGNRTGEFQLVFSKPGKAALAANKFNGTAIDNGKNIMKVELVLDPAKKPLSARIKKPIATPVAPKKHVKEQPRKASAPKKKSIGRKGPRRGKKSLEELDAEMTDYFKDDTAPAAATA